MPDAWRAIGLLRDGNVHASGGRKIGHEVGLRKDKVIAATGLGPCGESGPGFFACGRTPEIGPAHMAAFDELR